MSGCRGVSGLGVRGFYWENRGFYLEKRGFSENTISMVVLARKRRGLSARWKINYFSK